MKIAINLRAYVAGKIGGIENIVRNVCGGIAAVQERDSELLTIFAQEPEAANLKKLFPYGNVMPIPEEQAMCDELAHVNYDLLFCPLLVLDPLNAPVPSAILMPDLQHEFFPEFFDRKILEWRNRTYRESALRADLIFTISQFSKKSIVERYGVAPEKIEVLGLDADDEFRKPTPDWASASCDALGLPMDYVFFPANFWPHKNHSNLLRAMRLLERGRHPQLGLVLTGAPSTGADRIKKEIAKLGLRNAKLVGYQPKSVLAEIYRRSKALVFASKFEGFGIPLLEAFHTGIPAITSDTSSCPEIAGDAALLVDENDPASIAAGIARVIEDANLRDRLVESGRQRTPLYAWSRTIERTLECVRAIPGRHKSRVSVEENPVVSVVTPSYNMARFLEETIQSVLSQDYPHIDYLVMDGGSTDGTHEILKKYESLLRYQSAPDRGQADAINKGFANTRGPIFAYLNADDTYLPGAVGTAVRHLRAKPKIAVVYGEGYHVDEAGRVLERYPTFPFDSQLLNSRCFICQPTAFMRRDVFQSVGMMSFNHQLALDYDLWIRVAKTFMMCKIDEYLATSRLHKSNITIGQRGKVYKDIIAITKSHYGYVPQGWIHGYACYLMDGKDQFFERSRSTATNIALTLMMGSYYNRRQLRRYWKEWAEAFGVGGDFKGRWDDGWVSKRYSTTLDLDERVSLVEISGKHFAPNRNELTMRLNGNVVARRSLLEQGPFQITIKLPPGSAGKRCVLEIESSRTFRPVQNADYRRLSCIIDSVVPKSGDNAACPNR